jgi:predicted ATPase
MSDIGGDVPSYRLLETTRHHHALDTLVETGERDRVLLRLAEFYCGLLESAEAELERAPVARLTSFARRVDSIHAALDWALSAAGEAALGIRLAAATVPL